MKIYELAKQLGMKTGDLSKAARDMGISKAGNFTPLSSEQAQALAASFRKTAAAEREKPAKAAPAVRHTVGEPLKSVSREEDRLLLARRRERALSSFMRHGRGKPQSVAPQEISAASEPVAASVVDEAPAAKAAEARPEPAEEKTVGRIPEQTPEQPKEQIKVQIREQPGEEPGDVAKEKPGEESREKASDPPKEAAAAEDAPPAKEPSVAEVAPPQEPITIDLNGFGQFGAPSGSPRVVFHPAAVDDDDDDYEEESPSRRQSRYEDESDEDLQKTFFGGKKGAGQPLRHHKSESREDADRSRGRAQHGQNQAHRAPGASVSRQQPMQQRPGTFQRNQPAQQQPGPARPGQQRPAYPQQGRTPPGRAPQQSVFSTRAASASVFPTRQGGQSVFPTRQGQAQPVFPTRQGAQQSVFPTRPAINPRPQNVQAGNVRGQQPVQGKNQRGQQPMNKNQRPMQQAAKGKTPPAPPPPPANSPIVTGDHVLTLRGPTLIRELAEMMDVRPNRLIADLMQEKILVSINQRVDLEMAGRIAGKYGFRVELERARRSTERKPEIRRLDEDDEIPEDKPEDMRPRPPVVTFMGHVDHGKTSLLDYIRKTKVAAGEAGGITQHIGAYSVTVGDRSITFLDTPGHAAFSAMRARGARLTDIAVIVVAADDGIMPQTKEVIRDCRQSNVQIMVAINKCDLPSAKPDRVRQQLQGEGLTPEEWGGDVVCCEVSAHTGAGMDNLLEMILLQSDVLELQANPSRRADGYVIEAQMERGIGPTATLLVSSGTLSVGDVVLIDDYYGRLRALTDDRGHQVKSAGPATAVRVMGLNGVPEAGAEFRVMTTEKRAKELSEKFAEERKATLLQQAQKAVNIDTLLDKLGEQNKKQLSVIVKADTQGTVEAIIDTLRDIRSEKITLEILASSVGNVSATDVQRAAAGKAIIVGFQVNTESGVIPIATHDGVRISTFRIIYELFDFVKQSMLDLLDPEYKEVVRGHAQIRQIFDIGKLGKVAGCQLLDGIVRKDALVRVKRLRDVLFEGKIASLRHFKDEVAEVRDMQEFGVNFDGFEGFREGDVIECYSMEELERTL